MMLDGAQTERWAEMQADLRDALDKRRALARKPADPAQVPNPALLFIQDMASAESALGSTLDKLSRSMQAALDALNERQRKIFVEKMTAALSPSGPP
jgi:DNA-directed RNA polymerase specialized sigma24 family protein